MSAGTSFHYPQQELQQELKSSRRKVQVMEDTLHDLLEELQFIHRQAEQLQDQRGQVIHNALGDLIEEMEYTKTQINTLQHSLDDATAQVFQQDSGQHLRELLVRLLTLALRHWEEVTGHTKLELAEQSGIWAMHEEKGYLRVRTFDRYLSVPTLPKKPRWKDVTRTVRFVLSHSESSSVAEELTQTLREFQRLLLRSGS